MEQTKRIIILGATGSIGLNAIDVVKTHPDAFRVTAVAALRSREKCEALARELGCRAYVGEESALRAVEENEAEIKALQAVNEAIKGVKAAKAAQKEAEEHLDAIRKARLDTTPTLF